MTRALTSRYGPPLAILAAAIGAYIWQLTPRWVGITPDSVDYIIAAKNLASGLGLTVEKSLGSYEQLQHFPPLYPLILAGVFSIFGFNLGLIWWLNLALLVISGALFSLLTVAGNGRSRIAYFTTLLFVLSVPIISLHAMAWSEPLFLSLTLFSIYATVNLLRSGGELRWLIATGIACGAVLMTRYLGVAVVVGIIFWILTRFVFSFMTRIRLAAVIAFLSIAPIANWKLILESQSVSLGARAFAWHPITGDDLLAIGRMVASWFVPAPIEVDYVSMGIIGILLALAFRFAAKDAELSEGRALITLNIVSLFAVVIIAKSTFDSQIYLESRIFVLLLPLLLLLLFRTA